jgi:hypothetical protein
MLRALSHLPALVSLVLLLLCVTLWTRSVFRGDVWHLAPGPVTDVTTAAPLRLNNARQTWHHQWSIHSAGGRIWLVRRELQDFSADKSGHLTVPPAQAALYLTPSVAGDRHIDAVAFRYFRRDKQSFGGPQNFGWYWGFLVLSVPYWVPATAMAAGPALWLRGWHRRRRARLRLRRGQCPRCGYDLRATTGPCPECGFSRS